ncbi:unnamed protein product [Dovyalis caffra]|uniref:Uncharacterized protein n=1 Tax=Dovyalis caffra TaxID=77055 RepID=A0AAV1QQT0_9ROSI|nr:unnamed protein product [Dovyalis caffra]
MRDWFSEQSIEAEVLIVPVVAASPPPRGAEVDAMYRIRYASGRVACVLLEGEIRKERKIEEEKSIAVLQKGNDAFLHKSALVRA